MRIHDQLERISHQRRAVDGDFVAELADFEVADDEDGFAFAQFGFAGDEHRATSCPQHVPPALCKRKGCKVEKKQDVASRS